MLYKTYYVSLVLFVPVRPPAKRETKRETEEREGERGREREREIAETHENVFDDKAAAFDDPLAELILPKGHRTRRQLRGRTVRRGENERLASEKTRWAEH
jgi:hypothetical protein